MPPKSTRRGRERATDRVSRLISYSLSSGAAAAAAGRSRRVHADTWRKEKWTDRALEANSHRSRRHNETFTKSQRTPQRICRIQFFLGPWSQKVVILFAFNRIVVAVWKRRRRKTKPTRRPTSTVRRRKINKTERRDGAVSSRPRRLSAASNGSARVYRNRRRTGPDLY